MDPFTFAYPARLQRQAGGFLVSFRDLPEALTDGADRAEALEQAADCLDEAMATRIAHGLEVPLPSSTRRGEVLIEVPLPTAAKAALYLAMKRTALTRTALAKLLGCDEKEVRRLLDPRHNSRLDRLAAAIAAAGGRPALAVRNLSPVEMEAPARRSGRKRA